MIIFDLDGTLADCEHRRHFVDPSKDPKAWKYSTDDWFLLDKYGSPNTDRKWKPDWTAFYEACEQDQPNEPIIEIFKLLSEDHEVQIWSGRCESVRHKTELWLWDHAGCGFDSTLTYPQKLKMRPIGDFTPDHELKERWLDEYLAEPLYPSLDETVEGQVYQQKEPIQMVFDDRQKVVDMWRRRGITCLQVAPGDF